MASVGLLSDQSAIVLAAFFISPLMTMLLGATWGACIGERDLARRSFRNILLDAAICWGVGAVVGCGVGLCLPHSIEGLTAPMHAGGHGKAWGSITLNSSEILSRGPPVSNLVLSAFVAVFSGVALALGYSGGISGALAGVAVSTALLPPLVNAGLMMALSLFYPTARSDRGDPLTRIAASSVAIYVTNVGLVCAFAFATLKLKRVGGKSLEAIAMAFSETPSSAAAHAWHDDGVAHRHTWPDDSRDSRLFCGENEPARLEFAELEDSAPARRRLESAPARPSFYARRPSSPAGAPLTGGGGDLAAPLLAAAGSSSDDDEPRRDADTPPKGDADAPPPPPPASR
jgi:hypothetical protein